MTIDTVQYVVDLTIDDGKVEAFERIAQAMSAGCQKEPGALEYSWYLNGDRKRCRLIEIYADANAVVAHLTGPVVSELVPKLLKVSKLTGFEVYGDPGPKASEMLAGFGAQVFGPWHGFSR